MVCSSLPPCLRSTEHARRKTVYASDVVHALRRQGRTLCMLTQQSNSRTRRSHSSLLSYATYLAEPLMQMDLADECIG